MPASIFCFRYDPFFFSLSTIRPDQFFLHTASGERHKTAVKNISSVPPRLCSTTARLFTLETVMSGDPFLFSRYKQGHLPQ